MSTETNLTDLPDLYWHCAVKVAGEKRHAIVNDVSRANLQKTVIEPWHSRRPFTVSGTIVRPDAEIAEIKIVHTPYPQKHYAEQHNAKMRAKGIGDAATDRRLLPLVSGTDHTYDLLFSGMALAAPSPDAALIERICQRLPQTARILEGRSRKGKTPFTISDEYDVQDLLHATLRAYIKYAVQEDPLPRVASAKSGRADLTIEELGVLIEVKYAHGPDDQKRIFEEYSEDLVLYTQWPHLRTLIYLIYNASDLRDPEAFEKLSATQEINGKRFDVRVVLA